MSSKHITIDGVEYIATPVNNTTINTGYERVEKGKQFYRNTMHGDVSHEHDQKTTFDTEQYAIGNYYNDEQLARDNARADNIFRQLRQWQALNDEPVNWGDNDNPKYSFSYNYGSGLGISISTINRMAGVVYFSSRSKVKEAYTVFKPDLLWYFTEYRQRLDEPIRA